MDIRQLDSWQEHTALLMEADPDMDMLLRYIDRGEIFGAYVDGELACIAVVVICPGGEELPPAEICYELKNIATAAHMRGRGLAGGMMDFLCQHYPGKGMYVGTADQGLGFYEQYGFSVSHHIPNFFTDNYPEPIFDNGVQCVDMVYLFRPFS